MVWSLLGAAVLQAQSKPSEYEVKAAYIYNFGRFVTWPVGTADQGNAFAVCVLGEDPFGPALDLILTGKMLDSKPVVTKRISKPQDATGCRILFIHSVQGSRLQDILKLLNQSAVLTVSDMPDFSQRGGMIQFVRDDNRIRFEINLRSTTSAGLTLSSELLKVASNVTGNTRGGD